jgi:hypothetical protein
MMRTLCVTKSSIIQPHLQQLHQPIHHLFQQIFFNPIYRSHRHYLHHHQLHFLVNLIILIRILIHFNHLHHHQLYLLVNLIILIRVLIHLNHLQHQIHSIMLFHHNQQLPSITWIYLTHLILLRTLLYNHVH